MSTEFSPVENELPLRWFRRLHLVSRNRLGVGRRAIVFAALTALPIIVWGGLSGHLLTNANGEPLLAHYGVLVRCLVAIPLFILAEAGFDRGVRRMAGLFTSSGIIAPAHERAFERTISEVRALRDSSLPWVFVAGVTIAWLVANRPITHEDTYSWAALPDGGLGFGGIWYAYVVRSIFVVLLLGWLWRIVLVAWWFWRVGRLELSLVPTHPDKMGGLGFVARLPGAFAPVTFALSAVVASRWAHEVAFHEASLQSFAVPAAAFLLVWAILVLLPLLALTPALLSARAAAIPRYSALVGHQGRLVHQRWIEGAKVEHADILDAPEIGPVADAATLFDAVKHMSVVPITKMSIVSIIVPAIVPMIAVAGIRIPLKDLMLNFVKVLL